MCVRRIGVPLGSVPLRIGFGGSGFLPFFLHLLDSRRLTCFLTGARKQSDCRLVGLLGFGIAPFTALLLTFCFLREALVEECGRPLPSAPSFCLLFRSADLPLSGNYRMSSVFLFKVMDLLFQFDNTSRRSSGLTGGYALK